MEKPGAISRAINNKEFKTVAASGVAIAATVLAANSLDAFSEHREQITTTIVGPSALAITYALLKRTLESAYREHRVIGWTGFIGAAAFVADNIYNAWS